MSTRVSKCIDLCTIQSECGQNDLSIAVDISCSACSHSRCCNCYIYTYSNKSSVADFIARPKHRSTSSRKSSNRYSQLRQPNASEGHHIAGNEVNTLNLGSASRIPPILSQDPPVYSDTVQCYCTDEFSSKDLRDQPHEMNDVDEFGRSPRHYAIHHNSPEMIASLLSYGANTHEVDHDGHSPLSYAVHRGDEECIREILVRSKTRDPSHELEFSNQMIFHPGKKLVVEVRWELPRLLEDLRNEDSDRDFMESILDLVTILGSGENYDCCTCGEYLSKNLA